LTHNYLIIKHLDETFKKQYDLVTRFFSVYKVLDN